MMIVEPERALHARGIPRAFRARDRHSVYPEKNVLDPRRELVLLNDKTTRGLEDRTSRVSGYARLPDGKIKITFTSGKSLPYRPENARMLRDPQHFTVGDDAAVEVDGEIWPSVREIVTFSDRLEPWTRVFYRTKEGEEYRTRPAQRVRLIPSATQNAASADVLDYFRALVAGLPGGDPLVFPYSGLTFVHPGSVLAAYLAGAPIEPREPGAPLIFPFRCNLSQRTAVENAFTHSVSIIEGPPGTGKTETILNVIANILVRDQSVAVVSHTNAAVDNVREKLDELGFGHVLANLGNREKRALFFAGQQARNARVATFIGDTPPQPDSERLAEVDRRLRRLQSTERTRAERRQERDAYLLEQRHFERHLDRDEVPDLERLPLLRKSAGRILDYLAESELEHGENRPGPVRRIRRYFRYGSLRGLDPEDTRVVLRLQRAYYVKRIAELDKEIERCDKELRNSDFDGLAREHQRLSVRELHTALGTRYGSGSRPTFSADTYRTGQNFRKFIKEYPVVLSTCHSLRTSANEYMFDYLIIDEASQVDPLVAGLALSCCRNLIVVGDQRQLAPVVTEQATAPSPPSPVYGRDQSILKSLTDLYGDTLPSALLREHYRCDPAIIGFCNKKFYDGDLIPYTISGSQRPMIVVRTVEGDHMRYHRDGGGRSNQREIDVIEAEVIPEYCPGMARTDIGVTTPYRRQADKAGDLLDQIESETVHKFQGRQKKVVVLTTVLSENRAGRSGLKFADDPLLINVAVSRAIERFILVTNHEMMPASRHIRDLVGYIRYHNPDEEVVDSTIISIFDLLYDDYSKRLRALSARLKKDAKYPSENIAQTVLEGILAEERYAHLTLARQVLLRHFITDRAGLTPEQNAFVGRTSSVDFAVYNRITNELLLVIEIDGFTYHEDNPDQRRRDAIKDSILNARQIPYLRLPTTGSREEPQIRAALDRAETHSV